MQECMISQHPRSSRECRRTGATRGPCPFLWRGRIVIGNDVHDLCGRWRSYSQATARSPVGWAEVSWHDHPACALAQATESRRAPCCFQNLDLPNDGKRFLPGTPASRLIPRWPRARPMRRSAAGRSAHRQGRNAMMADERARKTGVVSIPAAKPDCPDPKVGREKQMFGTLHSRFTD